MNQTNQVIATEIDNKDIDSALKAIEESKGITRNQILGPTVDTLSSPETLARIHTIKSKLDGNLSSNEVSLFGLEIGEKTNTYTKDMLSEVQSNDLESLGNGLTIKRLFFYCQPYYQVLLS